MSLGGRLGMNLLSRFLPVMALAGLATFFPGADIQAEVKPSLDSTIVADESMRQIESRLEPPKPHWSCRYGNEDVVCSGKKSQEDMCRPFSYVPPFPFDEGAQLPCDLHRAIAAWAPVSMVRDGEKIIANLLEKTARYSLPSEDGTVIEYFGSTEKVESTIPVVIFRCQQVRLGSAVGSPFNCSRVAFRSATSEWKLRAITGGEVKSEFNAIPDFDIAIYAIGRVVTEDLMAAIRVHLAHKPLLLTADPRKGRAPSASGADTVLAIAEPHWSRMLGVWVWPTVRVDRYSPRNSEIRYEPGSEFILHSELLVTLGLYVNSLNTNQPHDWHLPSNSDINKYLESVKIAIGAAIEAQCRDSAWLNDRTLMCEAHAK